MVQDGSDGVTDGLRKRSRPGDAIIWGQGTAEPTAITSSVISDREALQPGPIFVGATFSDTLEPASCAGLQISSYGTLGNTRALAKLGLLDVIPCHVSRLGAAVMEGRIPCDVAIVQMSPPGPNGKPSLGLINDYIRAAMNRARVVVAEVNEQMPWTYGPEPADLDKVALTVHTSRPLVEVFARAPSDVEHRIGQNVAALIGDGMTLQVGIGGTIDAMLQCLSTRSDLGIHSGAISDAVLNLIEKGAVTNARKPIDPGITVTAALWGSERLHRFADRNPAVAVHPYEYTHAAQTLARIDNLVTVNSAVELDLTGQVNAEIVNGRYVGAVGGQVDFMHAGTRSGTGFSVIALPATASGGAISRIRPSVEVVTCSRSEVDFVVTEFGHADLRGRSLRQRVKAIIAIAHPAFREELEASAAVILKRGY